MIKIANAPCSGGVIENIEGERGGYRKVLDEIWEARAKVRSEIENS